MAKFFEFKPTFGWSELIALVAAIVAVRKTRDTPRFFCRFRQ